MTIEQIIQEYLKCSKICHEIKYDDKLSVKKSNAAVDKMYKLVKKTAMMGEASMAELIKLLDDPIPAKWLAHQLIEKASLDAQTEKKCFLIVENLALGDSLDAMGEKMWLKEWKRNRNSIKN